MKMSIYKRGHIYWYKFMWNGKVIRESTKQGNDKKARDMQSKHRARLADEEKEREKACEHLGCSEVLRCHECEKLFNADKALKKASNIFCSPACAAVWDKKNAMPTLQQFLEGEHGFLKYAESRHKHKPLTFRYYKQGCDMLLKSQLATLRLDELSDQHAQRFAAQYSALSPSGINRGLRTLRRSLNLAFQWGKVEKPVRIALAPGERQRDRVLSEQEEETYLSACPQPWKDCATIMLDEGFRPGEVFALRWSHILLNKDGTGFIQIVDGKTKAARRILPMTARVYALLLTRFAVADKPEDGWLFANGSDSVKHITDALTKGQHRKALVYSGVKHFVPYTLRHTALTRLGEAAGNNVFEVALIAGHTSLSTTKRYVHPQAEAINRVFAAAQLRVGTKLGTTENASRKKPRRADEGDEE
jgi:integrase